MSSILKALKKLEKDTINSKPEQLKIDARILHEEGAGTFIRTKFVLFFIIIFMCGGGATYYYMSHSPASSIQTPKNPRSESLIQTATSTVVAPILDKATTQTTPQTVPVPKVTHFVKTQKGLLVKPVISQEPSPPEKKQQEHVPSIEQKPLTTTDVPTSTVLRPALTVNGIAYQDDGKENMAMINGSAVSKGTMIDGVIVEDIQKDRVLFSQGGERFEIRLNKSNK